MNSWTLWLCAQPHGRQWGASKLAYPPHATGLPLDPHKASSHTCTHTRFHHGGAPQGSSTLGFPTRLRLTKQKNSQRHGFPNRGSAYKRFCHIVPTHELPHKGLWHTIPLQNFPQTDSPPKNAPPPPFLHIRKTKRDPSHRPALFRIPFFTLPKRKPTKCHIIENIWKIRITKLDDL